MERSEKQEQRKKKTNEVKTFLVPFPLETNQRNLTINSNSDAKISKEQIINQAFKFHSKGNIPEASKCYQYFINQGFKDHRVFSNYGTILRDLGKLKDAELSYRKAIELNPEFAIAHYNLGSTLKSLGNIQEAESSTRKAIELKPDLAVAHSNLGIILREIGKLKEAELSTRKAIELKPDLADAHSNLGNLMNDLGNLPEAEVFQRKAIELQPDLAMAYFSLSNLQYSKQNMKWKDQLFSESILSNKSQKDHVDIYFARANILHKEKNYKESATYLILANQLKLILKPSYADSLINQSKVLLLESDKQTINQKEYTGSSQSVFIVGMPRSGSTLLESILSMNTNVDDLGESKILEETFLESNKSDQILTFAERYWKKIKNRKKQSNITTNKNLYNYLYAGIIAKTIPNAKIIHCYRNPLDNILSIYRTHFAVGNQYSSCLVDCARVYLDQESIMTEYKKRFRSKIYDLNYDSLVSNPKQEIKSLISWLGWEWDDAYLTPHLNTRSISTASSVQVRFPINSKSIGGWKNYANMLKPAIEILTQTDKYREIAS
tara:strand:- start:528 stop:2180 length:1653 start_codon:yes stop_codon:yes gene_type:complete